MGETKDINGPCNILQSTNFVQVFENGYFVNLINLGPKGVSDPFITANERVQEIIYSNKQNSEICISF